jgi:hypothetical protein
MRSMSGRGGGGGWRSDFYRLASQAERTTQPSPYRISVTMSRKKNRMGLFVSSTKQRIPCGPLNQSKPNCL